MDEDANFHGKFGELMQDVGINALCYLLYIHSMERKYDALEKEYQNYLCFIYFLNFYFHCGLGVAKYGLINTCFIG